MALRTLVLGGARSGKSGYAEGLPTADRAVTYVATARRDPADAEWDARIAEHVERRPADWQTVELGAAAELPALLGKATADGPALLVDDLATWLTRLLDETAAWSGDADALAAARQQVTELRAAVLNCVGELVLVSAEAGLGVVPTTPAGRLFRDELGALNTAIAEVCPRTVLVVAGIPVALRGELPAAEATTASATPQAAASGTAAQQTAAQQVAAVAGIAGASAAAVTTVAATASAAESADESTVDGESAVTFEPVTPPDEQVRRDAEARQQQLTKPAGSLGRLEQVGVWISACQGVCPPKLLANPRVVVFAGDHGVADRGVSAFPKEVTVQMVANFLHGGAAVNVLAGAAGATVRVVDMAVDGDTAEHISTYKVRRASGSIDREDALTQSEVEAALAAGKAIADEEIDSGADLLVAGDMGIANTTPSAVLIAALTGMEPVDVIGRGTGIDDEGWMRKAVVIRDALRRARKVATDPVALLRTAGGADLAAMAGFLAQAAIRHTPVALDGVVVGAAAMVAEELAPGAKQWWVAGHQSVEPAHKIVLDHLGLKPLLNLDMRLGEGSGAVTALPLISSAVRILSQMATFAEAGVSDKDAPVG